jgi:cytochrome P450
MSRSRSEFDFTSPTYLADPAPAIARLRATGPLVHVRLPIIGKVWVTTTQEMAARVLKDSATFPIRKADGTIAGMQWWMPGIFRALASNMLTMDEPGHSRLRGIVDEAFRRREIVAMTPRLHTIADGLAQRLFAAGEPADIVGRYARQLPLLAICELLGLPDGDHEKFSAWANAATDVRNLWGFLRLVPALSKIKGYLEGQIDTARRHGGAGLIGELVRAECAGADISRDEMVAMVFLLLFAGHETTTHLISGSVFEILRNDELRRWLTEDWSRANLAVEEFLRIVSPVQLSKPRFVRRNMELGGVQLRAGEKIMAFLGAANYDPAIFDAAEVLDPARRPNRHIAFGTGIHFCLGHQLARIEGQCALEALFRRWPQLALAAPEAEIRWRSRAGLRAISQLHVRTRAH